MKYTTQKKFNKSLLQGSKGEQIIGGQLHIHWGLNDIKYNLSKTISILKGWDIKGKINAKSYYFEVKTDLFEYYKKRKTDNMFLEITCNGKASGIEATKSDYFIYYYPEHEVAYIMYVKTLKNWLETNWKTHMSSGGDSNVSFGYLISRFDIERSRLFDKIEHIPQQLFFNTIKNP
jgi:hypothetical protein